MRKLIASSALVFACGLAGCCTTALQPSANPADCCLLFVCTHGIVSDAAPAPETQSVDVVAPAPRPQRF